MPLYEYQAVNAQGQAVAGNIDAPTASQAVIQLEAQGLSISSIGQSAHGSISAPGSAPRPAPALSPADVAFREYLPRALERGAPLTPALRALVQELPRSSRRQKLKLFVSLLEGGDPAAAQATFAALPEYWIPLIGADQSPPSAALSRFLSHWRQTDRFNQSIWGLLAYSLIVLAAAAAVLVALSELVVPTFANVFADFGLRTPWMTQVLITVSRWIAGGQIILFFAAAVAVIAILWFAVRGLPKSAAAWLGDRFGSMFGRSAALARFTRHAADLLEAEIPTPAAVELAGIAAKSPRLYRAATRFAQASLSSRDDSEAERRILPATVMHAFTADISGRSRVRLLRELSEAYFERARARRSWTSGIVEPLAIIVIGFIVGWVVIALYLPLVSLVSGLA
jgi:type IV pilus assembly protein PilC